MSAQFETKIDFTNPIWNRDTWARIQGDLNPENQKFCDVRGVILGVKPGEKTKNSVDSRLSWPRGWCPRKTVRYGA